MYAGSFPRELCASITGLGPLYASRVKFLLEGFLTSAAGTPPHMGVKMFLLVLHYLEICLYIVEALSAFWSPERDYFLQWKVFSSRKCGLGNLGSSRIEVGLILGSEGSPALFHWSLHASFSSEKFSFGFRRRTQHFGTQVYLVGGPYSSVEDVLRSPSLPGIYLPWDLEQVWTNLMISTPVGSFCF